MNILNKIIERKKQLIEQNKRRVSVTELEQRPLFKRECLSLRSFLCDENKTAIIAEFKRKSPSKGIINHTSPVTEVTAAYAKHGASGISVLTDGDFFGGSLNDLEEARFNQVPLLRKDFIIYEYQLIETKAYGADVILLIAACLSKVRVKELAFFARNLGLNVLLEIHNEQELDHICNDVDVIGVNNRDLKTFNVDINRSIELSKKIPAGKIKISESGIEDAATIRILKQHGFTGFLIGEKFMKENNPGEAFKKFISDL